MSRNYGKAFRFFKQSAQRGDRDGEFYFGMMFIRGWGTKRDVEEAAGWIRKAAEKGQPEAMRVMSTLYEGGYGVAQSEKDALVWLETVSYTHLDVYKRQDQWRSGRL